MSIDEKFELGGKRESKWVANMYMYLKKMWKRYIPKKPTKYVDGISSYSCTYTYIIQNVK